jgi:lysozyme family protein
MIEASSSKWNKYTQHILNWEGGLSKDPRDSAASCVSAGQYHTNKGVTYCTFKANAAKLNIQPVTYDKFINLTDEEIGRFIYSYYKSVSGGQLPDSIALAMTEAAWGSGVNRAYTHLKDALRNLGWEVKSNAQAIAFANKANQKDLYDAYNKQRANYLINTLGSNAKYKPFVKGWTNRLKDFYTNFTPVAIGLPIIAAILFFLLIRKKIW